MEFTHVPKGGIPRQELAHNGYTSRKAISRVGRPKARSRTGLVVPISEVQQTFRASWRLGSSPDRATRPDRSGLKLPKKAFTFAEGGFL
jgi:hypothetical protein